MPISELQLRSVNGGLSSSSIGQHHWLEEHRRQSHLTTIGDRCPTHWQRTRASFEAVRPMASRYGLRSTQHTSTQTQRNGTGRRGKPWRLLRMAGSCAHKNGPGADGRAEAARVGTADRGGWQGAHAGPVEVLALSYELGCLFGAIPLGLRRRLRLLFRRLCGVADTRSLCA